MQNTTNKPKVFVVGGPTASGKTSLSIEIAQYLNCPIINADSRQTYKELDIGVAKPTKQELSSAKHYMVSCWDLSRQYSVADYTNSAYPILEQDLIGSNNIVITGGTGFYIKALFNPLDIIPIANTELRKSLETILKDQGMQVLTSRLNLLDPLAHLKVDMSNPRRVIRAIEMIEISGRPLDELWGNNSHNADLPYDIHYFAIDHDRTELYTRINKRVDIMIESGLEDEVRNLIKHRDHPALQSVGYTEFFEYFDCIRGLDETIDLIKQKSRNYAKRQITWFKNQLPTEWLTANEILNKVKTIYERSTY